VDISSFPILSLIIFLPLAGALVIALIPRRNLAAIRGTALLFALATWVASLWLVLGFLPGRDIVASAAGSFQFVRPWTGSRTSGSSTRWARTACPWRWSC